MIIIGILIRIDSEGEAIGYICRDGRMEDIIHRRRRRIIRARTETENYTDTEIAVIFHISFLLLGFNRDTRHVHHKDRKARGDITTARTVRVKAEVETL
jgi:hypothetical protein